jgi:ABC-2 type transport system permease protein
MNFALFKATLKSNWLIFMIFVAILFMYMSIMVSMYDPDNVDAMAQMYEMIPEGIMDAFGYGGTATDLVSFISLYFYGFIVLLFPLIYCIIMANRLVAAHVDRGSMAYLLSTPNTRVKIVTTQAVFMAGSIILLLIINAGIGLGFSEIIFPGEMDIPAYLLLNLVTVLFTLAISSICFFFSCIFNEAKYSLAFGAGIPILFFVINMLRNISDKYEWLQYLTIYTLYNPEGIITGETAVLPISLVFVAMALVLYSAGVIIFSRRNLYL